MEERNFTVLWVQGEALQVSGAPSEVRARLINTYTKDARYPYTDVGFTTPDGIPLFINPAHVGLLR